MNEIDNLPTSEIYNEDLNGLSEWLGARPFTLDKVTHVITEDDLVYLTDCDGVIYVTMPLDVFNDFQTMKFEEMLNEKNICKCEKL